MNDLQKWCQEILPIVQAAANGDEIEFYCVEVREWRKKNSSSLIDTKYRGKPKMIKVNGFDVPKPVGVELEWNQPYFSASIDSKDFFLEFQWVDDVTDKLFLSRALIHLDKESAIAHAKAMLGIDPYK